MTHDLAIDLVIDSLVEPLDAEHQRALDEHLASCTACVSEAGELRRLWDDMDGLEVPLPGAAAAVRLGKRLAESRRARRWAPALRAAAAVFLLGTGVAIGRMIPPQEGSPEPVADLGGDDGAFLFLIRGTEPDTRGSPEELFEEYSMWASELDAAGRLLGGERLTDDPGLWVGKESPGSEVVSGFFVIRAADYGEAERIAMGSPHIALGGVIEVRAIDH